MSVPTGTCEPFTVAVCTHCRADSTPAVVQRLRAIIRRCPHGMLVTTSCLLGQFTCAASHSSRGAMVVLQPCAVDQVPSAAVFWVGPVVTEADEEALCDWVAAGAWSLAELPPRLRADANLSRSTRLN
ncbi:hypothetical protein [Mycolicibacterium palauense]|uniref:hypothetical protein n=1 Tax=Mycolicibacterium palauense TaxID=2034511 RepID=UPI00114557DD|nr:hypothetical protein [Mycolicibacterium palauense]